MGERGNIVFLFAPEKEGAAPRRIYFCSHWRGHLLHEILREAMNHKEMWPPGFGNLTGSVRESCRWYDASYFARVVFCKFVAGDEGGVLSFGIDVNRTLPDYDELHVDVLKKQIRQVRLGPIEGADGRWSGVAEVTVSSWTFDEFAAGAAKVTLDDGADLGVSP